MIAKQDIQIADAAKTIYRVSTDNLVRSLCEGREEGEKTQRIIRLMHEKELAQKDEVIHQKDAEIARLLAELNAQNRGDR